MDEFDSTVLAAMENIVRIGRVTFVDVNNRLARVAFLDKQGTNGQPLTSGVLKVLQNQPLITVEKWVMEEGAENKWDYESCYASADRKLGLGETYTKRLPDIIKNEKVIKYEKRETIEDGDPIPCSCGASGTSCPLHGIIEYKKHRQTVTVYPWLPYIDQLVLCIYLLNGESEGFIVGGL